MPENGGSTVNGFGYRVDVYNKGIHIVQILAKCVPNPAKRTKAKNNVQKMQAGKQVGESQGCGGKRNALVYKIPDAKILKYSKDNAQKKSKTQPIVSASEGLVLHAGS